MKRVGWLLFASAAAGCSTSPPLPDAEAFRVKSFLAKEQSPHAVTMETAWYANGSAGDLACGEFEAPPALRSTRTLLRFIYDLSRSDGQIEMHELWVGDPLGMAAVAQNRMIFDDTWTRFCAPYAPFRRRVTAWLGG